jgi:hypothetical protein
LAVSGGNRRIMVNGSCRKSFEGSACATCAVSGGESPEMQFLY